MIFIVVSKEVDVKIAPTTMRYYEELGYAIPKKRNKDGKLVLDRYTSIKVKIEHLPKMANVFILAKCDYCGQEKEIRYDVYTRITERGIINRYACQNCMYIKQEESMLKTYGFKKLGSIPEFQEKQKNTNIHKYGVPYYFQTKEFNQLLRDEAKGSYTFRDSRKTLTCFICGVEFKRYQYKIKDRYFCSTKCSVEYQQMENHPNWKGGIVSEKRRLLNRLRSSIKYAKWRTQVFKRDNYICQICGSKENIRAHHLESFANNADLRFSSSNGITLCSNCHDSTIIGSFHNLYGTINNNYEQFLQYLEKKTAQKEEIIYALHTN